MTSAILMLMLLTPVEHLPDSFVMCGPDPLEQCLIAADQCLTESAKQGYDIDEAWEFCVEQLDPAIVHFR